MSASIYNSVAPQFRKRKLYAKEWLSDVTMRELSRQRNNLQQHMAIFLGGSDTFDKFINVMTRLDTLCLLELRILLADSMANNRLLAEEIFQANTRLLLAEQIYFVNYERGGRENAKQGRAAPLRPLIFVTFLGDMLAMLAIFGNKPLFQQALNFCLDLFDRNAINATRPSLTQLWMFRLAERFFGYEPRNWLADTGPWSLDPCGEEPLLADLWQHWDTEDMALIASLLMQLANRHTYQTSRNNKDDSGDFEGHSEQYPMELHFIMRLRQWRGLANPDIKHVLTEPPFDKLPEPVELLEFPEELHAFMKKVRQVIPDFDEIVNAAKKRDWCMLL